MTDTTAGWVASHRAPREGMDAWASPDPASAHSSELEGGAEVQFVEAAGEWAKVRGSNGWEGWVDGRLLEQVDTSGAAGDARALTLLAIAVVVLLVLAVMGFIGS